MTRFSDRTLHAWNERSRDSARVVLPIVCAICSPRSAIDVGCLFAAWGAECRRLGVVDVVGVDGHHVDRRDLLIPFDRFVAHDLRAPLRLERTFDVALSLEVAHYLPEERAAGFVADLCALAPLVLFSSAIPHQGGGAHVNEQWPAYWAAHFRELGYAPVDCVRDEVWDDPRVASWYAQNTLLFVAPDHMPSLRDHRGYGRAPARVHPHVFMTYADGRYHSLRRRASDAVERMSSLAASP